MTTMKTQTMPNMRLQDTPKTVVLRLVVGDKMNKYITAAMLCICAFACSVKPESGEIVRMPDGYSNQQTQAFIQTLITRDLLQQMYATFPTIKQQQGARFDFFPVVLKGLNSNKQEYGIITKLTGLDNWDKRDEFEVFLVEYLKRQVNNLQHAPPVQASPH